jgi:LysM repeat protein
VTLMELLGPGGGADGGTGDEELLPQPNGHLPAAIQEGAAVVQGDLLVQSDVEADGGGRAPDNGAFSPETEEPLDPSLVELFLEAKKEVEESVPAADLPDIPIRDLLSELVSLRRSLRVERPEPVLSGAEGPVAEPTDGGEDSAEPEEPHSLETAPPSLQPEAGPPPAVAGLRRHALHGLLLILTFVLAVASVLMGANRIISTGQSYTPTPSATATTEPGVVVSQVHPTQATLEPVLSGAEGPAAEASPEPTPAQRLAYVIYTVERGDTLSSIIAAFGISPDHVLWANPDVIDDPNLLPAGEKLLIPSVGGLIYHLKPGDVLSVIGRLLAAQGPDGSGSPAGQAQTP